MEKTIKPISGFIAVFICLGLLFYCIYNFLNVDKGIGYGIGGTICIVAFVFLAKGLMIIQPNHSRILTFFGKYVGSVKNNGLFFVNPLFATNRISLRSQNFQAQTLKVNDKMGNPIEIGAVIVWKVNDTYKAAFEVADYTDYVRTQSEAAIRHLAVSFPYDNLEDENADITLRDGAEKVNQILETELTERLSPAGILVQEARLSHLAYASEIAGAMLQRQQATAIVAARTKIVEGAVGMVDLALKKLSSENLMVVLCGEKAVTPILNTGSLYQ